MSSASNPVGSIDGNLVGDQATKVVFRSGDLVVGTFDAEPNQPHFDDSGPAKNHLVVFPTSAVWIADPEDLNFVADPNVATFYNRGHRYRRRPISPRGDSSFWIAPDQRLLQPILKAAGRANAPQRPFSWRMRYVPPRVFCLQRALWRYLLERENLEGEEAVNETLVTRTTGLLLRGLVLAGSSGELGSESAGGTAGYSGTGHWLSERTKALIDQRFAEPLSLQDISDRVGCSHFHLARQFRANVGVPIHHYRDQLRLRTALIRLPRAEDLSDLALELGYDSHSHFTSRFRRTFGVTPRYLRDLPSEELPGLMKRLGDAVAADFPN